MSARTWVDGYMPSRASYVKTLEMRQFDVTDLLSEDPRLSSALHPTNGLLKDNGGPDV